MTSAEARAVCDILTQADGGQCSSCSGGLFEEFIEKWPEFAPEARAAWVAEFDEPYDGNATPWVRSRR